MGIKVIAEKIDLLKFIDAMDRELHDYFIEISDEHGRWFSVSRDKQDGTYYFCLLLNDKKHLRKAKRAFTEFMRNLYYDFESKKPKKDATKNVTPITLDDIYDITSLTSADSIEDLYAKFIFVYNSLK